MAVDTTGAAKVRVTGTVQNATGAITLNVQLRGSNNQTNWFSLGGPASVPLVQGGAQAFEAPIAGTVQTIDGFAYVDVLWSITTGAGGLVLSANLSLTL